MRVSRDVVRRGIPLLRAGTRLTDKMIQRLRRWRISRITVEASGVSRSGDVHSGRSGSGVGREYAAAEERVDRLFEPYEQDSQMDLLKLLIQEAILERGRGRED